MWTDYGWVTKLCRRFNDRQQAHELTFSCRRKLPLLNADRTREWLIESMARARQAHEFDLLAYVIMPDHAHVLIFPRKPDYSISTILQAIKQPVARKAINFLRKHSPQWLGRLATPDSKGRVEYQFWQPGGGYDRNVTDVDTLRMMVDYIHRNPVRRGLVDAPEDWHWSGARWFAGHRDVPIELDSLVT